MHNCENCSNEPEKGVSPICKICVRPSDDFLSIPSCWKPKMIKVETKTNISRADILEEAKRCVCGQREQDYGSPEDNFKTIANLWTTYKGTEFTAEDVAMMMALLKIARISTGTATRDSFVDLAGYAACGGEIKFKGDK